MEKRYNALRFIGNLYKIVGIIVGVITILGALGSCIFSAFGGSILDSLINQSAGNSTGGLGILGGFLGGFIISGILLLYGGMTATLLYAAGEAIYLLINMEENTRTATLLLQQGIRHY
jgi:hypothetical protein